MWRRPDRITTASAETDAQLTAGILSWSRSRGVFAGLSVGGATLRNDLDQNQQLYGKRLSNQEIVMDKEARHPAAAAEFLLMLNKYSPRQTS